MTGAAAPTRAIPPAGSVDVAHVPALLRLMTAVAVGAMLVAERGQAVLSATLVVPLLAAVYVLLSTAAIWPRSGVATSTVRPRRLLVVSVLDVAAVVAVALWTAEPRTGTLLVLSAVPVTAAFALSARSVVALSGVAAAGCVAARVAEAVSPGAGVSDRALVLLLVAIAGSGAVARSVAVVRARRTARIEALAASAQDLLLQALDAGRQERARVADLLHDDVLQLLIVTGQDVADAIDGDLEGLPAARSDIDAAVRRLRDTIAALRLEGRQDELLGEALSDLAGNAGPERPASVDVDVARGLRGLEHPVLVAIARDVVRDAATSDPGGRVTVTAAPSTDEPGTVVLVVRHGDRRAAAGLPVEDDELGDVARRLIAVGGTLDVERGPAHERTVTVRVPVGDAAPTV